MPALFFLCLIGRLISFGAAAQPAPGAFDPNDLSGVWWNGNTSVSDLEIVGEAPELTPAGEARFAETLEFKRQLEAAAADLTDISNCVPAGVPRIWAQPHPVEIAQKPDLTALIYEHMHSFRVVHMNRRPFEPDEVEVLHRNGHSVGRWENGTLVIESSVFDDSIVLDERGLPASQGLRTVERLRKIDEETLEVVTTIEDPEYYLAPWTVRVTLERQPRDAALMEFTCGYGVYETRYATLPQ